MSAADHEDFHLHEDDEPHHDHATSDDDLVTYLNRMMVDPLDFFDHYLRDQPGVWQAPRVCYEVANAGWRTSDSWEPAGAVERAYYFEGLEVATESANGGTLILQNHGSASAVDWRHDLTNPVPYLGESEWGQCANLPDESVLHARADVVTFTSAACHEPIDLIGPAEVELTFTATSPRSHAIVRLLDVYPSGRSRVILEGASLVTTCGEPTRLRVRLGDTAYRLRPGHAFRVAVSGSCFPLYPVLPGNDDGESSAARIVHRLTSTADAPCFATPPGRAAHRACPVIEHPRLFAHRTICHDHRTTR